MKLALMDEPGSDAVVDHMREQRALASCRVTAVELRATLAAARRAGRRVDERAVRWLGELLGRIDFVEVDGGLCDLAGAQAESHGLRTLDALHLAAARRARAASGEELALMTWDGPLRRAARRDGLRVLPHRV